MCKAYDKFQLEYDVVDQDERFVVITGLQSDSGQNILMLIAIEPEMEKIRVLSKVNCKIAENMEMDIAIAINSINLRLVRGFYTYTVSNSEPSISFELPNSIVGVIPGEEVFLDLLLAAFSTTKEYHDKLMLLANGTISLDKFLSLE